VIRIAAGEAAPPPYRVQACNLLLASENNIHDDQVSRRFGFAGGLVPGVEVYVAGEPRVVAQVRHTAIYRRRQAA
jgi:hypothetical protein